MFGYAQNVQCRNHYHSVETAACVLNAGEQVLANFSVRIATPASVTICEAHTLPGTVIRLFIPASCTQTNLGDLLWTNPLVV